MDSFGRHFFILLIVILPGIVKTQVLNDDCFTATVIQDISDFCSSGFTNIGAQASSDEVLGCWGRDDGQSDVWYSFVPRNQGLLLRFFGSGEGLDFTINNTAFALYEGRCSNLTEVACIRRDGGSDDIFEQLYTNLTIGRTYFIRIGSEDDDAGTFQLCMLDFVPVPNPEQDCPDAVVLCDKNPFVVERIEGVGLIPDEAEGSCLNGIRPDSPPGSRIDPSETSSVWYKWTAKTTGSLTFTLTPNNDDPEEDLDFAIYRLPNGLNDCQNKELLMCMASGANAEGSPVSDAPCMGPTGLNSTDSDSFEFAGCDPGDNNFLRALEMTAGESYALVVNNFSETGFGFSIEFGGTGEFFRSRS